MHSFQVIVFFLTAKNYIMVVNSIVHCKLVIVGLNYK